MISGDSKVYLLSKLDEPKTVADLATAGIYPLLVFTAEGRVTIGQVDRFVKFGVAKLLNVTLDDGTTLKVTPDQRFQLLDGTACKASELTIGKSLLPLYLSEEKQGYPMFAEIGGYNIHALTSMDCQRVRKVARMVGEFKHGDRLPPGTTVSHIDGNKKNCHPDNLNVIVKPDAKQRKFEHPFAKSLKDANAFIKLHPRNHKVALVSDAGSELVYGCASVSTRNLAVNGVFLNTIEDE